MSQIAMVEDLYAFSACCKSGSLLLTSGSISPSQGTFPSQEIAFMSRAVRHRAAYEAFPNTWS